MPMNNSTAITVLAAPVQNMRLEVLGLSLYNKDTNTVSTLFQTDNGAVERIINRSILLTNEMLGWEQGYGWYSMDATGARKEN